MDPISEQLIQYTNTLQYLGINFQKKLNERRTLSGEFILTMRGVALVCFQNKAAERRTGKVEMVHLHSPSNGQLRSDTTEDNLEGRLNVALRKVERSH